MFGYIPMEYRDECDKVALNPILCSPHNHCRARRVRYLIISNDNHDDDDDNHDYQRCMKLRKNFSEQLPKCDILMY